MKAIEVHTRRDGSTYKTVWVKTDFFCPICGKQEIWEDDCDDYYMGTEFFCGGCGGGFRHPTVHVAKYEADRLTKLRKVFAGAKP